MSDLIEQLHAVGLTPESAERARAAQAETGEPLPVVISRIGLLPDTDVVRALSSAHGLPEVESEDRLEDLPETRLTHAFMRAHRLLVLEDGTEGAEIALVDPSDHEAIAGAVFALGKPVKSHVIGFHAWRRAFDRFVGQVPDVAVERGASRQGARWTQDRGGIEDLALDAPAVRRVESLIAEAVDAGASDIHIERKPDAGLVRFRIDGRLEDRDRLSRALTDGVIARLKVLGDLDVADHRRAQDGRTSLSTRGRPVDVRLSIIPSAHGEGAVIRLLDRSDVRLDFPELGFRAAEIERIRAAIARPQGLYLVSGPTGGGKTTTLYAALNSLRSPHRKTVTVEDPIEYFFEDVHQTQLDPAAGLSFSNALRAFLRYDPDIILVGEIRDPETAKTAVQAALTGHLVLSTIHANDAASVPARLMEMGVEPYLVASTLNATSAQRLVRKLCPHCAAPAEIPEDLVERAGLDRPGLTFKRAVGCNACTEGYSGRLVISETLVFTDEVEQAVRQQASNTQLRALLGESLFQDGMIKAGQGLTSADEVLRALEAS